MGWLHRAGLAVAACFLFFALLTANLTVGLDRTVLNSDFAAQALEESDAYERATATVTDRLGQDGGRTAFIARLLDPADLEAQVEHNLERFYSYLHGRTDSLVLELRTAPLRDDVAAAMETRIRSQLVNRTDRLAAMLAGPDQYQATKTAFRQRQYQRIQNATPENLSRAELDQRYQASLSAIRTRLQNQTDLGGEASGELQDTVANATQLTVTALTTDMEYTTFADRFNRTLETAATAAADRLLGQVPFRVDLTNKLSGRAQRIMDLARRAVTVLDILTVALPLLAVLIAGLAVWTASSTSGGLALVGGTTLAAGAASTAAVLIGDRVAAQTIQQQVTDLPPEASALIIDLLGEIVQVLVHQSLVIAVVGAVILAAAYLKR